VQGYKIACCTDEAVLESIFTPRIWGIVFLVSGNVSTYRKAGVLGEMMEYHLKIIPWLLIVLAINSSWK
jgi:hypothetical protein